MKREGRGWAVSRRARPRVVRSRQGEEIKDGGKWYQLARRRRFNLLLYLLLTSRCLSKGHRERTTGDSRGKRKSVSDVTCGPAMLLIALPAFNYLPPLLRGTLSSLFSSCARSRIYSPLHLAYAGNRSI